MHLPIRLAALLATLMAAAPAALAQPTSDPADARFATTTLDLTADGEVKVAADIATINLGVVTERAPTAADAMRQNAQLMTKVVAALRAGGIDQRDIQTSSLSLSPQYIYLPNQPPTLTGYEASNQVTVTVRDLTRLGAALDAVVNAGATNFGGVQFGLVSRVPAENAARLAAVKALDDKAALYADAAGYHIRRLVNLSEGVSYDATPRPGAASMRVQGVPVTAVETGDLTVRVDVTGEFELIH